MSALQALDATPQHGWQVVLNASDIVGLTGIVVSILSIAFGIYQLRQAKRAEKTVGKARALLLRQQISQHFTGSAVKALTLLTAIRQLRWEDSSEAALLLFADLSNAVGFPEKLLGVINKQNANSATALMGKLIAGLPTNGSFDLNEEQVQELIRSCQYIFAYVNAVEGSLRLNTALGGEEDEQPDNSASTIEHDSIESQN